MLERKNILKKSSAPEKQNPNGMMVGVYPLEAIMAMQKALETGIEQDGLPQHRRPPLLPRKGGGEQNVPVNSIQRLCKTLISAISRLGRIFHPALAPGRHSKRSSAR